MDFKLSAIFIRKHLQSSNHHSRQQEISKYFKFDDLWSELIFIIIVILWQKKLGEHLPVLWLAILALHRMQASSSWEYTVHLDFWIVLILLGILEALVMIQGNYYHSRRLKKAFFNFEAGLLPLWLVTLGDLVQCLGNPYFELSYHLSRLQKVIWVDSRSVKLIEAQPWMSGN